MRLIRGRIATCGVSRTSGLISKVPDRRHRSFGGSLDGGQGGRKIGSLQAGPLHLRTSLGQIVKAEGSARRNQDMSILAEDHAVEGRCLKPLVDLGSQAVEKIHQVGVAEDAFQLRQGAGLIDRLRFRS